MESEKEVHKQINPKEKANIFSRITFWYTLYIFRKAFKKEIDEDDLYEVSSEHRSKILGDRMEEQWDKQKHKKNFPMFIVFWNLFLKHYSLLGLTRLVSMTVNVLRPIMIAKLVLFFVPGPTQTSKLEAYIYGTVLTVITVTDIICRQNYFLVAETYGVITTSSVSSLIYRKLLKVKASCLRNAFFGRIVNVVTRDVNIWDQFFYMINEFWSGAISLIILCYNMYQKIGIVTWTVVGILALYIPFQVCLSVGMTALKRQSSLKTDERISAIQEVLSSIRTAKMYVWEKYLEERLKIARRKEMDILLKLFTLLFVLVVTAILIQYVILYIVLMTCVWMDLQLTAEAMYFIIGTVQGITFVLTTSFPYTFFYASQFVTTLRRLQVLTYNMDKNSAKTNCNIFIGKEPRMEFSDVTVTTPEKIILKDVNLKIGKGLTLLMGGASSGKSVFLLTVLKEFDLENGDLITEGKISYASQEPWLFPSTIRQNILFGTEYDEKRYHEVLRACALEYDFKLFVEGDSTIVADHGLNLSKGQQSRISLARAIYRESDIYLLDDCLSCLDPLVADYIFSNCIRNYLSDKLVLLVTHNANLIPYADHILTIRNGNCELYKNETTKHVELFSESTPEDNFLGKEQFQKEDDIIDPETALIKKDNVDRIYGEIKKGGSVSPKVYWKCIDLGGGLIFFIGVLCIFVLTQLSKSYNDKLISDWATLEENILQYKNNSNTSQYEILLAKRTHVLYAFTFATISVVVATLLRAYILFLLFKRISINLHNQMTKAVTYATMKFFDSNFTGNIVNRFSKDLVTVDENIPFFVLHFTAIIIEIFGSMLFISVLNLRFLIPTLLLFLSSIILRQSYLKAGRPLKRLEATTKSPVVGYINATLRGLSTIKAFDAEEILQKEFERRQDVHASTSYTYLCTRKAFTFVVDLTAAIFIAVIIFQFLIFEKGVFPGEVGLIISQAFHTGVTLYFGLAKWAELETEMTAVERAVEYIKIPPENKSGLKLDNWPKEAEIKFENVYLTLNNAKSYVLKNINFVTKPGQSLGIVGRTGAGKSSIISALFRLYEIEGRITIDGEDIKSLSLSFLRSQMSVIPQIPILFDGTLRDNIDPGKIHSNEDIWKCLNTVTLNEIILNLDVDIKELNLACGQKQLICLARVLLNKNKILVLDEMTENVDFETENLIFKIIDSHFESYTVIKIAHKLKFVMTCDKILVLDHGEIIEYDSPCALLQNKDTLFYEMVTRAGLNPAFWNRKEK